MGRLDDRNKAVARVTKTHLRIASKSAPAADSRRCSVRFGILRRRQTHDIGGLRSSQPSLISCSTAAGRSSSLGMSSPRVLASERKPGVSGFQQSGGKNQGSFCALHDLASEQVLKPRPPIGAPREFRPCWRGPGKAPQEVRHIAEGEFVLLPAGLRGIGDFIRPSRLAIVPGQSQTGCRLQHRRDAFIAPQDCRAEIGGRGNNVTECAKAPEAGFAPKAERRCFIPDFARRTFDQIKLVSQQD